MATKADRKKQKKSRREAKKAAQRNAYNQRARVLLKRFSAYPEVLFDESEGTPEFIEEVKKAQCEIDLDDPKVCDPAFQNIYRIIREAGFEALAQAKREAIADGTMSEQEADLSMHLFMMHYGTKIYERIPLETRKRLLPYNDMHVSPLGKHLVVSFSSLLQKNGTRGTIFYSRKRPTVNFGGHDWPVGFSRHSIEQAVLRLNPHYYNYSCSADVHAFFANCVHFEPAELDSRNHLRQPAFSMFDFCDDPTFYPYQVYVRDIFGLGDEEPDRTAGKFYFRLGYFPIEIDSGFAKAVSFMRPGYTGTPELKALVAANDLSREHKAFLLRESRENTGREALLNGRTEVIKWFHDNAVPQVKQISEPVFDYSRPAKELVLRRASLKGRLKQILGKADCLRAQPVSYSYSRPA